MKKYIISISILTVILITVYLLRAALPFQLHASFSTMLVFFSAQSVVVAVILWLAQNKQEQYGMIALGIVVLRLITGIIFLIVMYVAGVQETMLFAVQFMILYLFYLVFELTVVLANLRRN